MHTRILAAALFVSAAIAVPRSGIVSLQPSPPRDANAVVDPHDYQALRWRSVGPTRGGRVTAITGVRSQPCTFYIGGGGGGVWKTTDCGDQWAAGHGRAD